MGANVINRRRINESFDKDRCYARLNIDPIQETDDFSRRSSPGTESIAEGNESADLIMNNVGRTRLFSRSLADIEMFNSLEERISEQKIFD